MTEKSGVPHKLSVLRAWRRLAATFLRWSDPPTTTGAPPKTATVLSRHSCAWSRQGKDCATWGVLGVIHREHRWMGRVINGEHRGLPGFGLRWAGARRHVEHVGMGPALPVTFGEARGGP